MVLLNDQGLSYMDASVLKALRAFSAACLLETLLSLRASSKPIPWAQSSLSLIGALFSVELQAPESIPWEVGSARIPLGWESGPPCCQD